jgi:predicted DNA-binding transcriptional regulator YafY
MAKSSQLARQWQLLRILESLRFGISVEDLADKAECSRRTVERDLTNLRKIGFPISCESRDFGKKFWRLERRFLESEKLIVGPTEMISMHLAKQLMTPLSGTCFGQGLEQLWGKIKTLLPKKALDYFVGLDETFYVKFFDVDSNLNESEYLETIRKAINENNVIRIEYNPDHQRKGYITEFYPYGLVLYEGSMYLIGHSVQAEALRTFKVKRLTSIKITKKTFQRPEDFSLERCVSGSFGIIYKEISPITVRCEFRGWATRLLREQKWHRTQVIEKDSGDKLLVSFLLDTTTEFKKWILGFGPIVRVLEPEKLRDEIVESLKKSLKIYQKK